MTDEPLGQALGDEQAADVLTSSTMAYVLTNPRKKDNPIVYVNRAFERLTGYNAKSAVGRNCRFLQCEDTNENKVGRVKKAIETVQNVSTVLVNQKANGEKFLNALIITPIFDSDEDEAGEPIYFLGLQREVRADHEEEQLEQFETAITEIQHRVKNHLSMILSLIQLQARNVEDADQFSDVARRIESIQLLYEEMTVSDLSDETETIRLGAYLSRVASAIHNIDGRPGIRMNVDVDSIEIEQDTAGRIGLIVSEVLTNAMQHAFADRERGLLELRASRRDNGRLQVTVSDDGVGVPEGLDWPNGDGLGSRIVRALTDSLGAKITLRRGEPGTVIAVDVPLPDHE